MLTLFPVHQVVAVAAHPDVVAAAAPDAVEGELLVQTRRDRRPGRAVVVQDRTRHPHNPVVGRRVSPHRVEDRPHAGRFGTPGRSVEPDNRPSEFKVSWVVWMELALGVLRPDMIAKVKILG